MSEINFDFYSDEAELRFQKIDDREKDALIEIQKKLKKKFKVFTESENNIVDIADTKFLLNKNGFVTGLYIGWNQIEQLPKQIADLTHLTEFYAQVNKLTTLPNFWDKLPTLQKINLFSNELEEIPDTMAKLSDLRYIDLSYNQFGYIPDIILDWKTTEVDLTNNPIEYLSWEILESDCICYFTKDAPRMGIGYNGDINFVGYSEEFWLNAISKYSGYRRDSEKVWKEIKNQMKEKYQGTKQRILKTLKKGEYLDYLDFYHPDFEEWVGEIKKFCKDVKNEVTLQVLNYLRDTY